jgi:hypothetical protein
MSRFRTLPPPTRPILFPTITGCEIEYINIYANTNETEGWEIGFGSIKLQYSLVGMSYFPEGLWDASITKISECCFFFVLMRVRSWDDLAESIFLRLGESTIRFVDSCVQYDVLVRISMH